MADIRIGTSAFTARFVEPMECEPVSKLREGLEWVYEVNLLFTSKGFPEGASLVLPDFWGCVRDANMTCFFVNN